MNEIADELNPGPGQDSPESPNQPDPQMDTASQVDREELETLRKLTDRSIERERQLEREVRELREAATRTPPPPPAPLPDKAEDPVGHLSAVMDQRFQTLAEQLQQSVKPLQEFTRVQQNQTTFANAAIALSNEMPQLKNQQFWTDLYNQLPSTFNPTQDNVRLAALTYYGQLSLAGRAPQPVSSTPARVENKQPTPPRHEGSRGANPQKATELTEGQRRAFLRAVKAGQFKDGEEQQFVEYLSADTRTIDMGY